jgi:uncharacterized RDD family membrane protein YckC
MQGSPPLPPPPPVPPTPGASSPAGWAPPEVPGGHPPYAGFWQRFGALLIDGVILSPIWILPFFLFVWQDMIDEFERSFATNTEPDVTQFTEFFQRAIWWGIAAALVSYVYNALMIGRWNATVGKFALGLRVRRPDGSPAAWREAFLRPLLQAGVGGLNALPGLGMLGILDYLWMLWDDQKQTLHDKIASTIVVVKEPSPLR